MKRVKTLQHLKDDLDISKEQVLALFDLSRKLKKERRAGIVNHSLSGMSLAMIFEKPSTRTRVSFEVGMTELGGHALYLGPDDLQTKRGESLTDTAKTLSRYVHGIMARVFDHNDILELARSARVPVINGLSDRFHPCQALTDLFTIYEKRGTLTDMTISFVGDGDNNVTNSLLLLSTRLGVHMHIACPQAFGVRQDILSLAKKECARSGAHILVTSDPEEAVTSADVIYTDAWVSMGKKRLSSRIRALRPYQLNARLLGHAKANAMVMHCLPAHRGEEITNEVIDGSQSIVFDQAENRLHVQKALLVQLLGL